MGGFTLADNLNRVRQCALLPEYRTTLCITAKAASTSIIMALLRHYGATAERPYHGSSCFAWMSGEQVEKHIPAWRRALVVRHPLERLVAAWHYHCVRGNITGTRSLRELGFKAGMDFPAFLRHAAVDPDADAHTCVQTRQLADPDFILRTERLDRDWPQFWQWLGAKSWPKLGRENDTPERDWRSYYSDLNLELAARVWSLDLEPLGYSVEEVA